MEIDKELVEFIIETIKTNKNYTKERIIEDLELLVKEGNEQDEK